jgi:hypothetical protein
MQAGERVAEARLVARPEPDLVIDLRDPPPAKARRDRAGLALLVAMNVLNLLDAAFTYLVTRAGIAVEANPLVEWLTLPGKVVLVAALSFALWKLRPRALAIPVVAYAVVVCYTIGGALLFSS